ncbi:DNA polymerase III subunit alpha [Dietzia timorensis]|uniref:DNA polymerase III subunit alpha n=1 Tax=Dietzia timorensis TaxID=499555 RepID=A0A173LKP0_9ACTN|nr:DNA polymerase III subunit alpha [Dietzia timorensis]ANI92184.1 DNA polymerase III subunit alpha [Dietzia timorensis]
MSGKGFVHLHNHTEFSMLDGMAQIKPLFAEASRLGMPAVGMTDHGNMYGASDFYREAKKTGIKPIIGIEAYVAPESRTNTARVRWGEDWQKSDDVSGSGAYTHMTLVAENATGLRNLFRLSSLASYEGQLGKWPRMDEEILAQYAEGIIATSGCPSGEIQTRLRLGHIDKAYEAAEKWQSIFGKENFYLELMDHGLDLEKRVRQDLVKLGNDLGMPPLVTNDCHYVTRDQSHAHEAMLCIQTGKTLSDENRFRFGGDGYFLKSAEEIREQWDAEVPGACDNTLAIAERVTSYDEVWEEKDRMPKFPVPQGETEDTWLAREVHKGLEWRFPDGVPPEYIERADYELDVIKQKGYPGYFLVVGDLIEHARSIGIHVGPGRGSAAGALVAYALKITNIDPLEHGLLFERFLNPERPSAPDIDIDFDDRRRGEMIRYASDKWGADKIAQVITFGTIKTKAAIKDAARVNFGQPGYQIADRITKALPPPIMAKDIPLSGIMDPQHERYGEASEVRSLIETDPDVKQIYDTARGLEGMVRNAGVHACAVIMSSEPLLDCIPMWKRAQDGALITGWDYPSCEAIGLLKMDFLGLRNLTVIGDCLENIKTNRNIEVDLDTLGLDDQAAYDLLAKGDTLGVFQLDSGGMRELLKRMKPTGFNDIVAALALYRPGPMGMGTHWNYADRKNGKQELTPIHPELEEPLREILGETHGLIVYQEQIMAISRELAGYSAGEADAFRKAMGKKKAEVLAEQFEKFSGGMTERGYSMESVKALWNTIEPFASYAFNKSHAAGYGLVSYWTAYLKANFPAEYMAALLTSVGDDKDKAALYLSNCRQMGIRVLPPSVNESVTNFASVGEDIRFGMGAVRNVGAHVVEAVVAAREEKGAFRDFSDYLNKIDATACTKKVTESLIKAGAFDSMDLPRKGLYLIHADAVDSVISTKKAAAVGQYDLFADLGGGGDDDSSESVFSARVPDVEWDIKSKLSLEKEMLGLYVSGHPLDGLEDALAAKTDTAISTVHEGELPDRTNITIGGIISGVDRRVNKRGESWAIVTIEDFHGSVEVLFFPKSYQLAAMDIAEDAIVVVKARINIRDDRISVFGDTLEAPDLVVTGGGAPFAMSLPTRQINAETVVALKQVLGQHPGESVVHLRLVNGADSTILRLSEHLRVDPSNSLKGDLKALLGEACLAL